MKTPSNLQIPHAKRFGFWKLVFGICLGFGIWSLEFALHAQCRRGEIMTDAGCVGGRTQRGRGPQKVTPAPAPKPSPPQAVAPTPPPMPAPVNLQPRITDVIPSEIMAGESLIIYGENLYYGTAPQVLIEGEKMNVLASSPTQLTIATYTHRKNPTITVITMKGRAEYKAPVRIWSGNCGNSQINQAFEELLKRKPTGEGNEGQCNPTDYRGGQWSNYEQLKFAVRQRFGYVSKPAPDIAAIIPPSALPDSWVEIFGKNFDELQSVIFGSNRASEVERVSSSKIRAKVPFGAGSGITVSTLHGSDRWNGFDVLYPPQISGVEPPSAMPGSRVTIRGSRLKNVSQPISFSGWNIGIESQSDKEIVVTVPYKSLGKVKITLKTPEGQTATWDHFTVVSKPLPKITNVDPSPVLSDAWFTLRGENFNDFQRVTWGGSSVMDSEWISPTEIRVRALGYESEGDIHVVTKNGDAIAKLIVKKPPPPPKPEEPAVAQKPEIPTGQPKIDLSKTTIDVSKLTAVEPLTGNTPLTTNTGGILTGNTPLTGNTGALLTGSTGGVLTGNTPLTGNTGALLTGSTGGVLTGNTPLTGTTGGALGMRVQNLGKNPTSASAEQRAASPRTRGAATQPAKIPPYISRIEPSSAPPGTTINIYGKNLQDTKGVVIGEKNVQMVGQPGADSLQVTVPDSEPGRYKVTVNSSGGEGSWENRFEILGIPVAKKVEPAGGRGRRFIEDPASIEKISMPPPPPPSQVAKKKPAILPQPALLPPTPPLPAEEPQVAVRHEPQKEPVVGPCERGTWSPTLRTCVEDQVQEEVAPPDCGAGAHWSPTLQSCQAD